jgi:glycerate kinase
MAVRLAACRTRPRGLYIRPVRVLVAPDKFRGTLTARQAAEAIRAGWGRERPDDELELVPMADGGEGTMDALVGALGGRVETVEVTGPLGDPIRAAFGIASAAEGTLGLIEMARASGLELVSEGRRDPGRSTTRGTGELMVRALELGARRLLVCLGGSATNDGGAGMAAALGVRFLDAAGRDLPAGGAALLDLARIDASGLHPGLAGVVVTGACDVDNPLSGPSGASAVYGPQKGATRDQVWLLDRALAHLASVVHRDMGIALHDEPGAGAAGGLGFGLLAFCGARLRRGVDVVMDAVGLQGRVARADLAVTGEGSLDEQSLHGKVPAGVIDAATGAGVPVAIVCGRARIAIPGVTVLSMEERVGVEAAMEDARGSLELVAQDLAGRAAGLVEGRS